MRLENLRVRRLRAISHAELELSEGVNWIVGGNGAGKTTLLEAVFLLARGKSFRGSRYGSLIQEGRRDAHVDSDVVLGNRRRRVGVTKSPEGTLWWENGVRRTGLQDVGNQVHVRVIGENAQRLVEGDPELRRWFLDWNMFHVEPGYRELFSRFRRVLAQRNAWLRAGGKGRPVWDDSYVAAAEAVTGARRAFVVSMNDAIREVGPVCGLAGDLVVGFKRGWSEGQPLATHLEETRQGDVERGYTWYGPGRADLDIRLDGRHSLCSRGQNKIIVAVLQLASQRVLALQGVECVWLLDDLVAELAPENMSSIWGAIAGTNAQILSTALRAPPFDGAMFHVERGRVSAVA